MVPGEVVTLNLGCDLLFSVNGEILFQKVMHDEMRVFMFCSHLDWHHSSLFVNKIGKLKCLKKKDEDDVDR